MWAVYNCGGACAANKPKFLQYAGNATSGSCANNLCPADCTGGACDWCCLDMYPVVDGSKWVGWMGKAHVTLPASSFESQSFMTHFDWSDDPNSTNGTKTGSTGADSGLDGLCLNCTGERGAHTFSVCVSLSLSVPGHGRHCA